MQVTLNIGLETTNGTVLNAMRDVMPVISQIVEVESTRIHDVNYTLADGTPVRESTLIVKGTYHGDPEWLPLDVYASSVILRQDCISVKYAGTGHLYGPNIAKYGEFNDEYFYSE